MGSGSEAYGGDRRLFSFPERGVVEHFGGDAGGSRAADPGARGAHWAGLHREPPTGRKDYHRWPTSRTNTIIRPPARRRSPSPVDGKGGVPNGRRQHHGVLPSSEREAL